MTGVQIEMLRKEFGKSPRNVVALDDINLSVKEGELLVLLGPSGCGKSTTLRCVAGLETPTSGRITFGDKVVYDQSTRRVAKPEERGLGMVFQSYALWPHMTVLDNIRYPLKARNMQKEIKAGWAEEMADLVSCGHLLKRFPGELSGGQQQRISLARALVASPQVMLFDEPLSNLDAVLRTELRGEIRRLHNELKFTGIYVTHDQSEALAIATRIAILDQGKVIHVGDPNQVYNTAPTEWSADFMGFTERVVSDVSDEFPERAGSKGKVIVRFRPTSAELVRSSSEVNAKDSFVVRSAVVTEKIFVGTFTEYRLDANGNNVQVNVLSASSSGISGHAENDSVAIRVPWSEVLFFSEDGELIG